MMEKTGDIGTHTPAPVRKGCCGGSCKTAAADRLTKGTPQHPATKTAEAVANAAKPR